MINKNIVLFMLSLYYFGILVILLGIPALFLFGLLQHIIIFAVLSFLVLALGMGSIFLGMFLLRFKCCCPYCAFGREDRVTAAPYHEKVNFENVRKGGFQCPKCREEIKII